MKKKILITDPTLRDGNHAVNHQFDEEFIQFYSNKLDETGVKVIEVGHGNGIGASSISIGRSKVTDIEAIKIVKKNTKNLKISVHSIPGFSTLKDVDSAVKSGADIIRVGTNATEIDTCNEQIKFCLNNKVEVWAVLMMFHLLDDEKALIDQINKIIDFGVDKVILMDSAGYFTPLEIERIFKKITKKFKNIQFGFHAHNNYNLASWNSVVAINHGATIIDASIRGFGAGAGNDHLETLVTLCKKNGFDTGIDEEKILELAESFEKVIAKKKYFKNLPITEPLNILSAKYGLFSGFAPKVKKISKSLKINVLESFEAIGEKKLVAGQDDLIHNVLFNLKKSKK